MSKKQNPNNSKTEIVFSESDLKDAMRLEYGTQ